MEYIIDQFSFAEVILFAICGICTSLVAGEKYAKGWKLAVCGIFAWPAVIVAFEIKTAFSQFEGLSNVPRIAFLIVMIAIVIGGFATIANTVCFYISDHLETKEIEKKMREYKRKEQDVDLVDGHFYDDDGKKIW